MADRAVVRGMRGIPSEIEALEPTLREYIQAEWSLHGYFPCYGNLDLRGDPTLSAEDIARYAVRPIRPLLRISLLACAPFMLLRAAVPRTNDGHQLLVKTEGRWVLRFHAFFTDYYFYAAILRMLEELDLAHEEKARWVGVLVQIVEVALAYDILLKVGADEFRLFEFFTRNDPKLGGGTIGSKGFWSASGLLSDMEPDADTNFVLFEMYSRALDLLQDAAHYGIAEERARALRTRLSAILDQPMWKLIRKYQFRPDGRPEPVVNYTSVDASGGVTTFFTKEPEDAPDLVANVNVLRSFCVNARRWNIYDNPEAIDMLRGIVDFLRRNVASGLSSQQRGHSFYTPPFFAAMFGRLWCTFQALNEAERRAFDPDAKLEAIRQELFRFLSEQMDPARAVLNPLDAALALGAAIDLGSPDEALLSAWVKLLRDRFHPVSPPYRAYEVFKAKVPTLNFYGSEAITAAFVHYALVGYATHARRREGRS